MSETGEVFLKARELGEAILQSEVHRRMKQAEAAAQANPEAAAATALYLEKRQAVEQLLSGENPDPARLAEAGMELEDAERAVNSLPGVQEMQEARKQFTDMMESVNGILNLIVNGKLEESRGCTGSCATCGGCGK